jgi:N-acetylmuramoyl-L-alanine amidase
VLVETVVAALICLDPGHGTPPAVGRQREPIGPGSRAYKEKDGGGTAGEAEVVLQIAYRTRALLLRRGYRVAMTRTGRWFRYGSGGNIARAQFCNRRRAALMIRIHADGSSDPSRRGASTLYPALRRGWTDDIYGPSLAAARSIQRALVRATGARDLGLVRRSDLTGFNWANVPVVLAETGFMTNPSERRLLRSAGYQQRVARGLADGAATSVGAAAAHLLGDVPPAIVDRPPPVAGIPRDDVVRLVYRDLRGLELVPIVHNGTTFRKLGAQLLGVRVHIRSANRRRSAEKPVSGGARDRSASEHERQPGLHGGDAIVSPATCRVSRRPVPGRPHPARPPQTEGRHEGT